MWSDELVTQLEADGVGVHNVNIFMSSRASIPVLASGAATLGIYVTAGAGIETTHNSVIRPAYIFPSATLIARANSYARAEAMAYLAYFSLVKIRNQFIASGWYLWIKPLQEPHDPLTDARDQAQCSFTIVGKKRP